jgi:glycerol-3-phosphate acyltransferase PlsY
VEIVSYIVTVLAAYLLGSIPTGYLVARARGVDIRASGSGNIGATNVFRVLGKPAGIFVLVADGMKGYCACTWLVDLVMHLGIAGPGHSGDLARNLPLAAGITAILGHNYTCWLKFKGGKGVATTAAVLAGWTLPGFFIALATWLVVVAITRYVSLASMAAGVSLAFAAWFTRHDLPLTIICALLGTLAIYKHKANIKRLLDGTESRLGKKKEEPK